MATDPNAVIYDAIRKADAAGDSASVAALAAHLNNTASDAHAAPSGVLSGSDFQTEAQRRFDAGANAADLEQFAKDNGQGLNNLDQAIAVRDKGGHAVFTGFDTSNAVHTARGAIANLLGPQISRAGADLAGAAQSAVNGAPIAQNTTGREIAADADRSQFASDHPILAPVLGMAGSLAALPAKGATSILGGLQGALASDSYNPSGIALDAAKGAAGAFVGSKLLGGLGGVVGPHLSEAMSALRSAGINVAPGQWARDLGSSAGSMLGRLGGQIMAGVEDHATSLPIVGSMIQNARLDAANGFNRGAVNTALSHIGEALPDTIQTGHGAMAYTRNRLSQAYDGALSQLHMIPDDQLHSDLADISGRMTDGTLNADSARQLRASMNSKLGYRIPSMQEVPGTPFMAQDSQNLPAIIGGRDLEASGGQGVGPYTGPASSGTAAQQPPRARYMAGETVKSVDSELRKQAAQTQDPALRQALTDARQAVRSAAIRSSPPEAGAALNAADTAYAHYAVLRNAASKADNGVFTPRMLDTASRIADTTIGKRGSSEGTGLYQNYAENGSSVLTGKTGDSGTFTREATMNPYYWGLGALGAAAYPVARGVTNMATRQAGPNAQIAADLLRKIAPLGGALAAPAAVELTAPGH